jgi:histidine ammonia-lyase
MAAHGARRLMQMNRNLSYILAVETLCAAQGIEFREPLKTSEPLQAVIARLRQDIPALAEDRALAPDLEKAAAMIREGVVVQVAGFGALLPTGDAA